MYSSNIMVFSFSDIDLKFLANAAQLTLETTDH